MTFLDLDDDFEIFDNTEPVELIRPNALKGVEVCALRRQLSVREAAASGGAYTTRDVQFSIPRSKVCKTPPGVGSLLVTESGEYFTIFGVDKATLKSRYRVWCHEPVIDEDLGEVVSILEPEYKLDDTNAPYEEWNTLHSGVVGKIFVESIENEVAKDARQLKPEVMIYLKGITQFKPTWRVKSEAGVLYNVTKVTLPKLGRLIVLAATSARNPASM